MLKLDVLAAELNLWANETEQIYRATKESKYRGDAKHLRYLAATLNQSSLPSTGVTSFNTRVGDVVLSSLDVTTALGYNPVTQARTLTINGVTYDLSANRSWTISTAIPTLDQVTTAGNTTTNAITVGGLTISNGSASITKTTAGATLTLTPNASDNAIVINNSGFIKFTSGVDSYIRGNSTVFSVLDAGFGSKVQFHWGGSASWINTGGNLLIGTTTDAGYKLDVNGTARVQGDFTAGLQGALNTVFRFYAGTSYGGQANITFAGQGYNGVSIGIGSGANPFLGNNLLITRSYLNEYGNHAYGFIGLDNTIPMMFRFGTAGSTVESLRLTNTQVTAYQKLVTLASITASSALAQGVYFNNTLVAAANNDILVGLDIAPTFTNGAFTNVANAALRVQGWNWATTGVTIGPNNISWDTGTGPVNGFTLDRSGVYGRFRMGSGSGFGYQFFTNNTERLRIVDGNVMVLNTNMLVGTTTDSGYKLDVNGTARVQGQLTTAGDILFPSLGRRIWFPRGAGSGVMFSPSNEINSASQDAVIIMDSNFGKIGYQGGTHTFNALAINTNISTGGSYNGIVRGIYYNPTLTSLTGVTHRAIETTSGDVIFDGGQVGIGTTSFYSDTKLKVKGVDSALILLVSGANYGVRIGANAVGGVISGVDQTGFGSDQALNFRATKYQLDLGNVLIGTTTDAGYKLDVNGSAKFGDNFVWDNTNSLLTLTNPAVSPSTLRLNSKFSNLTKFQFTQEFVAGTYTEIGYIGYQWGTGMTLQSYQDLIFNPGNTEKVRITSTGNVGIGILNPTEKLHIADSNAGNIFARISAFNSSASGAWVAQNDQIDNIVYRVFGSTVGGTQFGQSLNRSASLMANLGGSGKFLIGSYSGTDLIFGTSDQARMRLVDSTGNFLIGTMTDSGHKLSVSGTAKIGSDLTLDAGLIIDSTDITNAWTAYTPTWSSNGGTQPTLGDGTITGFYKKIGKTVFVRLKLNFGVSTTGGTGVWLFSLPVNASSSEGIQFPCSMLDNGFAWYQGIVNGTYSGFTDKTAIIAQSPGGANSSQGVSGSFPFGWGNTDSLQFNGSYECI